MIGPAEIEDMLADYAEALAEAGMAPVGRIDLWPVTQPNEASTQPPIPYDLALERLRRASATL